MCSTPRFYKPALAEQGRPSAGRCSATAASRSAWAPATSGKNSRPPSCRTPAPEPRVDYLEHMTTYLKEHHPNDPNPHRRQRRPGADDRRLPRRHDRADRCQAYATSTTHWPNASSSSATPPVIALTALELNLAITAVPDGGARTRLVDDPQVRAGRCPTSEIMAHAAQCSADPPARWPIPCAGYREKYGLTCFTVQDNHIDNFAKVIAELR